VKQSQNGVLDLLVDDVAAEALQKGPSRAVLSIKPSNLVCWAAGDPCNSSGKSLFGALD
jgi:hypothetical protein